MAEHGFRPGPILLMGAPGVGKGTQAKRLMALWGVPQISTSDLLRANMASHTSIGMQVKSLMDAGALVPDGLVNHMVEQRLREDDVEPGYILDGYPRTTEQAKHFDLQLTVTEPSHRSAQSLDPVRTHQVLPVIAVSLAVKYTELLHRITGRRICPVCGSIYNVYLQPPARDCICDLDGALLHSRDDDSEVVFTGRMQAYKDRTAPVLEHYKALGQLVEVDGERVPDEVTEQIESAVRKLRNQ